MNQRKKSSFDLGSTREGFEMHRAVQDRGEREIVEQERVRDPAWWPEQYVRPVSTCEWREIPKDKYVWCPSDISVRDGGAFATWVEASDIVQSADDSVDGNVMRGSWVIREGGLFEEYVSYVGEDDYPFSFSYEFADVSRGGRIVVSPTYESLHFPMDTGMQRVYVFDSSRSTVRTEFSSVRFGADEALYCVRKPDASTSPLVFRLLPNGTTEALSLDLRSVPFGDHPMYLPEQLQLGSDGYLYMLSRTGLVNRISPEGGMEDLLWMGSYGLDTAAGTTELLISQETSEVYIIEEDCVLFHSREGWDVCRKRGSVFCSEHCETLILVVLRVES